jgi:hypothetical protein
MQARPCYSRHDICRCEDACVWEVAGPLARNSFCMPGRKVATFETIPCSKIVLDNFSTLVLKQFVAGIIGLKDNGVGMKVSLKKKVTEATLSYTFKFSDDYDWTLGGKLPGLSSAGKNGKSSPHTTQL